MIKITNYIFFGFHNKSWHVLPQLSDWHLELEISYIGLLLCWTILPWHIPINIWDFYLSPSSSPSNFVYPWNLTQHFYNYFCFVSSIGRGGGVISTESSSTLTSNFMTIRRCVKYIKYFGSFRTTHKVFYV